MVHSNPLVRRVGSIATSPDSALGSPLELRMAAIDVGSNSIHMAIAQVDGDGSVTTLWRLKEMVGLGRISFPSRRLSVDAMDRAVTTLRRFQHETRRRECEKVIAVATSAVREAQNGGEFVDRVRNELGLPLRVISARDEARLIYAGVAHAIDLHLLEAPLLIVDIGGGSVEFIVAHGGRALLLESCKLGAARMTAKYIQRDPAHPEDIAALLKHYDAELGPICQRIAALRPAYALGTSGTFENLSAMCGGQAPPSVDASAKLAGLGVTQWIDRASLGRCVDRLLQSTADQRLGMAGLDEKRQEQITAGALLTREIFRRLDLQHLGLCRSAMREGMLAEYVARHLPDLTIRRDVPDPRRRSVLDLARRCQWNKEHSGQVTHLSLQLFDTLRPLHGLKNSARELIEYGSLLHDIGWHIHSTDHHKHSMYLIQHGGLRGFEPEEVQIIASIARYHRKSEPSKKHKAFRDLSPRAQKIVRTGAALLRIGDGLDRTHCGVVQKIQVQLRAKAIRIRVQGKGDLELELWAARAKAGLLETLLGRPIVFSSTPG